MSFFHVGEIVLHIIEQNHILNVVFPIVVKSLEDYISNFFLENSVPIEDSEFDIQRV